MVANTTRFICAQIYAKSVSRETNTAMFLVKLPKKHDISYVFPQYSPLQPRLSSLLRHLRAF